jgi:RecA/RadA recombinase
MALAVLPRRDERDDAARAYLDDTARRVRPVALAGERQLTVPGPLSAALPTLQRGMVVEVVGGFGAGSTSVSLGLAAAASAVGEWAAAVELDSTLGGLAAAEAGVALERFLVVRRVPPARWASVVAALIEGFTVVVAEVPRHVRTSDCRRLAARAREQGVVLVVATRWPAEAAVRVYAEGWTCFEDGSDEQRALQVRVEGRGAAGPSRRAVVAAVG